MTVQNSAEQYKRPQALLMACLSFLLLVACAKNPGLINNANAAPAEVPKSEEDLVTDSPAGGAPASTESKFEALAWEATSHPDRKEWSAFAVQIADEEFEKLDQVQDAETFCPRYASLSRAQKVNFWGQLVAGVSYFESGWSPVSRYQETTMGTDGVTGLPVYSEGLLQLSYQDIEAYSFCEFNWSRDKHLSPKDPAKTILDPERNLRCGIKILADQVARKKNIVLSRGLYWAVLRKGSAHIAQISAITKKLSFCH